MARQGLLDRTLPVLLALALVSGCERQEAADPEPAPKSEVESISAVAEEGPVKATVTLAPKDPRLGDVLTLTLAVAAEADVSVEMPAFGEALGRFSIVDFTPRRTVNEDGSTLTTQRYRLQPPMSGRQRIPGLRIEYVDARDGTGDDFREVITDELAVEIESVLPEGDVTAQLRPARGELAELAEDGFPTWLIALSALTAGVLVVVAVLIWQRRSVARAQLSAFDRAHARLRQLESTGLPDGERMDAWYVELSDIVRRYIEDRYAVRAPELTTEEFLQEARRSVAFIPAHRDLLTALLESCDRVKFAAYSPAEEESLASLHFADRFLSETRLLESEVAADVDAVPTSGSVA